MNPIERHEQVVLQFSGGKDSLACLYMLRPFWDRIKVMWVNTGDAFPETIEQMARIREMVPHFIEVKSDQPANVAENGPPADVLAMWASPLGRIFCERPVRAQSPFGCCATNIWEPMQRATVELGATLIIRGQRLSDDRKSPVRSGAVIDGIEYWFPIESWTPLQVLAYLASRQVDLPEHYDYVNTSLDCQTCTAYLDENEGKFRYMKERHPALYRTVQERLGDILTAMQPDLDALMKIYDPED